MIAGQSRVQPRGCDSRVSWEGSATDCPADPSGYDEYLLVYAAFAAARGDGSSCVLKPYAPDMAYASFSAHLESADLRVQWAYLEIERAAHPGPIEMRRLPVRCLQEVCIDQTDFWGRKQRVYSKKCVLLSHGGALLFQKRALRHARFGLLSGRRLCVESDCGVFRKKLR